MKLGIICALDAEAENIVKAMTDVSDDTVGSILFSTGKIGKNDIVLSICGMGKVCAAMCAQTMIIKYSPDIILNTGIAGGLTSELGVGDVALSTALVQHDIDLYDLDKTPLGYHPSLHIVEFPADAVTVGKIEKIYSKLGVKVKKGVIASGDQFISNKATKEKLTSLFGAVACEMEGGAIAQVCYMNKVPFAVIRSVSDSADESSVTDYYTFKIATAKKSADLILEFLNGMPE